MKDLKRYVMVHAVLQMQFRLMTQFVFIWLKNPRTEDRQGHDNQFNSILNEFVQCDGDTTRARFYCEMF